MKDLDKTKVYYLGDLSDEQKSKILDYLQLVEQESDWSYFYNDTIYIFYSEDEGWIESCSTLGLGNINNSNAITIFEQYDNQRIIEINSRLQELNNEIIILNNELIKLKK